MAVFLCSSRRQNQHPFSSCSSPPRGVFVFNNWIHPPSPLPTSDFPTPVALPPARPRPLPSYLSQHPKPLDHFASRVSDRGDHHLGKRRKSGKPTRGKGREGGDKGRHAWRIGERERERTQHAPKEELASRDLRLSSSPPTTTTNYMAQLSS